MGSKRKLHRAKVLGISATWMNKYTIAALLFLVWISFFDRNNLVTQIKLKRSVSALEQEKKDYEEKLETVKLERLELERNEEKYAREKYYLRNRDQDVYIIEKE